MSENEFDNKIYDAAVEEEWREQARKKKRQERLQQMKKEKERSMRYRRYGGIGIVLLVSVGILVAVIALSGKDRQDPKYIAPSQSSVADITVSDSELGEEAEKVWSYEAHLTDDTGALPESVVSEHGILIDVASGDILAENGAYERISPASMTKILTVLVAAEHITEEQLDDTFTMTIDITDYSYVNECSNTGFEVGEVMTVRDLFYGTILPSGADSAVGLATYVAGSQEAFVDLMNEKLEEMGLSETTHFTNCVGLYDEDHYSTVYDMAMILKAASDYAWCREVLSTHVYTTSATEQHPEGMILSNWFLRRIEDKDTHGEVLCAKTGYVVQSGSCAASLAKDHEGKEYICVTAGSSSSWRCIYDHVDIYTQYLPE